MNEIHDSELRQAVEHKNRQREQILYTYSFTLDHAVDAAGVSLTRMQNWLGKYGLKLRADPKSGRRKRGAYCGHDILVLATIGSLTRFGFSVRAGTDFSRLVTERAHEILDFTFDQKRDQFYFLEQRDDGILIHGPGYIGSSNVKSYFGDIPDNAVFIAVDRLIERVLRQPGSEVSLLLRPRHKKSK